MPRALLTIALLATSACLPPTTMASTTAKMSSTFTPEHLGAPTTISLAFRIEQGDNVTTPLTGIELDYPSNLGFATSGLGVDACIPAMLEALGPAGCPVNSQMGYGNATVEIAFGPELVEEAVQLTLFAGPSPDGHLHVLAYARGRAPVQAALILTAVLLRDHLAVTVPPIASLPEAPYVSVAEMHLTIGGHLTYYENVNGRRVAYHPAGVGLPNLCPLGGFRFAATFILLSGERVPSHSTVACPKRHRPRP